MRTLLVVEDLDGRGPGIVAGGGFLHSAGTPLNGIALWNGTQWAPLGQGMTRGPVHALTLHDDGSGRGAELYAVGGFVHADGQLAQGAARWSEGAWHGIPGGVMWGARAVASFAPQSSGQPGLYVTGRGPSNSNIRWWDGSGWNSLGAGIDGPGSALVVHDDGTGPSLFVGGYFGTAGGVVAPHVARWDGSSWSALGAGLNGPVTSLAVYDDGSGRGEQLYAAGWFTESGDQPLSRIARWDGTEWLAVGCGLDSGVETLAVVRCSTSKRPLLAAGGHFRSAGDVAAAHLALWDGSTWQAVSGDLGGAVYTIACGSGDDSLPLSLHVGGAFDTAGSVAAARIARRDGARWAPLGAGLRGSISSGTVVALLDVERGEGGEPTLYAAGNFETAGGHAAKGIAAFVNDAWVPLGVGFDGILRPIVHDLVMFDDGLGDGPALYAAGEFTLAGGSPAARVARWNGSDWSAVGSGIDDGEVWSLAVFDDGTGPALYAGGTFTQVGGIPMTRVARWNGIGWSALGAGIPLETPIRDLCVADFGSGPALYTAGPAFKWTGSGHWTPYPSPGGLSYRLAMSDGGPGGTPALYAVGLFDTTPQGDWPRVRRFDGEAWHSLPTVHYGIAVTIALVDDGVVAGGTPVIGGIIELDKGGPDVRVARWNGVGWSALGDGIAGDSSQPVWALEARASQVDGPTRLFVGGRYMADSTGSAHLSEWRWCVVAGDLDGDGVVGAADLALLLAAWGACEHACPGDLDGSGFVDGIDLGLLLAAWGR